MTYTSRPSQLITDFILPRAIVLEKNCENAKLLLNENPRQAVLGEHAAAGIPAGSFLLLDFGTEIQGGISVTVKRAEESARLRIVFGESFSEAMSAVGEKNAGNDHSLRDMILPVSSWQSFRAGNTGFRFVKLEAVGAAVCLSGVQAAFEHRDLTYRGSFECSDPLLNQIWRTGAYTVFLNMQEYLWDGIKRDRLVWVGDMHPEVSTILCVFGAENVVKESLDLIRDMTPAEEWMNGKISYSMWWMIIHLDWYMATADLNYLKEQKEYLFRMLDRTLFAVNEKRVCHLSPAFVEWSSCDKPDEKAGFQAMLVRGLTAGSRLCRILGDEVRGRRCQEAAAGLRKHTFRCPENKQVAAMMALAEMENAEVIGREVLKPGGGRGLSAFWGYYVLEALAKADDMGAALDMVREYWGAMIKLGATTFWEEFDLDWAADAAGIDAPVPEGMKDIHGDFGEFCYRQFRRSLCHGWASGPTAFLSRKVLGIELLEPGFRKVKIVPRLGGLNWVRGSIPTPYGLLHVEHHMEGGVIHSQVNAPEGVEVLIT